MNLNHREIMISDDSYPSLLNEMASPPKKLHVRGRLPNSKITHIAIVGTRKASKQGLILAEETAHELARLGIVVVSGLAMGIDTASHKGALSGGGRTIAVLGNGIDKIYPAQNEQLAQEILELEGSIISEYPPGSPSFKGNFIQRNRIIAGLSIATIVIEAPEKSGALATARFAGEAGRHIFVFPGWAKDRNYAGSHSLIRDGAILVTSLSEVLDDLNIDKSSSEIGINSENLGKNERTIIEVFKNEGKPLHVDIIIQLTKLDPQSVSQALATLTIWRIIEETEKGYELSHR